jgi:hypothetical protein
MPLIIRAAPLIKGLSAEFIHTPQLWTREKSSAVSPESSRFAVRKQFEIAIR